MSGAVKIVGPSPDKVAGLGWSGAMMREQHCATPPSNIKVNP
jgi:hypothetical protein